MTNIYTTLVEEYMNEQINTWQGYQTAVVGQVGRQYWEVSNGITRL